MLHERCTASHAKMAAPVVKILESDVKVAEELCSFVIKTANHAINERNVFFVGVSGNL